MMVQHLVDRFRSATLTILRLCMFVVDIWESVKPWPDSQLNGCRVLLLGLVSLTPVLLFSLVVPVTSLQRSISELSSLVVRHHPSVLVMVQQLSSCFVVVCTGIVYLTAGKYFN